MSVRPLIRSTLAALALASLAACGATVGHGTTPPTRPVSAEAHRDAERAVEAGVSLVDRGRIDEALPYFDEALAIEPDNLAFAYEKAFALYRAGRLAEAVRVLEPLATRADSEPLVYQLLGSAYDDLGQTDRARQTLRAGLTRFPEAGRLYHSLGIVEARRGRMEAAVTAWERGMLAEPTFASNYYVATVALADVRPMSAAIYGEVFMNLEAGSERTLAASRIVRAAYERTIAEGRARAIAVIDLHAVPLGEQLRLVAAAVALPEGAPVTTDTLVALRAQSLAMWREGTTPSTLLAWRGEVADAGHAEAYDRWVLGAGDEFAAWCGAHARPCQAFVDWFKQHEPTLPANAPLLGPLASETDS